WHRSVSFQGVCRGVDMKRNLQIVAGLQPAYLLFGSLPRPAASTPWPGLRAFRPLAWHTNQSVGDADGKGHTTFQRASFAVVLRKIGRSPATLRKKCHSPRCQLPRLSIAKSLFSVMT